MSGMLLSSEIGIYSFPKGIFHLFIIPNWGTLSAYLNEANYVPNKTYKITIISRNAFFIVGRSRGVFGIISRLPQIDAEPVTGSKIITSGMEL